MLISTTLLSKAINTMRMQSSGRKSDAKLMRWVCLKISFL